MVFHGTQIPMETLRQQIVRLIVTQTKTLPDPFAATVATVLSNALVLVYPDGCLTKKLSKGRRIWMPKNQDNCVCSPSQSDVSLKEVSCIALVLHENYQVSYELYHRFRVEAHIRSPIDGALIRNRFKAFAKTSNFRLSPGAQKILTLPNAGGNSLWSEVMSFEILSHMFSGKLLRTEMELQYWPHGCKITDYSMELFGITVGVSVTRAMKFNGIFAKDDATNLLTKKLRGVNESSRCVLKEQSWNCQILHVWASHEYVADVIHEVWKDLEPALKSNTLIVVSICENANWIFQARL
jgi:hypothetical protein